jgi:hypothetical protein
MGHTHGIKWTEEKIIEGIKNAMDKLGIGTFPTSSQLKNFYGHCGLCNKISKTGGFYFWANKLGLKLKDSDTNVGLQWELICSSFLNGKGYKVEKMSTRHPYDLMVNQNIKIDVKTAYLYTTKKGYSFYTFNLEKKYPSCDIYVCYCLNDDKTIKKTYVIPSALVGRINQLSVGEHQSIYDKFIDKWEYIQVYDTFYKSLGEK